MVIRSQIQIPDHIPLPSPLRYLESRRFVSILIRSPASFHNTGKILFLLVCMSWTITGQPQNNVFIRFVRGQDSTMWDIVWFSPQGHRSVSVSRHFFLQALQCPCFVQKRGRIPVAGMWGRTLGENWPPEPTSSYDYINFWCQLVASPATAASWMSVVAVVG